MIHDYPGERMGLFSGRKHDEHRLATEKLAGELQELRLKLDEVTTRLTTVIGSASEGSHQMQTLEARIEQVGVEVTHQLGELSDDLERLAREQARYQIAFRQDLAEVADLAQKKPGH